MTTISKQLFSQGPDSVSDLLEHLSPKIYRSIKTAIELGKWGDGSKLSKEQRENCMQLLILYEAVKLPERARTGRKLKGCSNETTTVSIHD